MTVGSHILGHKRLTYQISAQKKDSSYVKQIYQSRYGLKMLKSHEFYWSMYNVIYRGFILKYDANILYGVLFLRTWRKTEI